MRYFKQLIRGTLYWWPRKLQDRTTLDEWHERNVSLNRYRLHPTLRLRKRSSDDLRQIERAIYRGKKVLLARSTFTLHLLRLQLPPPLCPQRPRERLQPWPSSSPRFRCPRPRRHHRLRHHQRPRRTPLQVLHCLHHPRPHPLPPLRGPPVPGRGQSLLSSREGLYLTGRCRVSSLEDIDLQGMGWI